MARKNKPIPTKKSSIENYIDEQVKYSDNIYIIDDVISKEYCLMYKEDVLSTSDSQWTPGIKYGDSGWPISEWGYTIMNDMKWHNSPIEPETKEILKTLLDYSKEEFDIEPIVTSIHLNGMSFGQEALIHKDSSDGSHIFFVLFFNDDMDVYDGGDFQTYISLDDSVNNVHHKNSEVKFSVRPLSGRFVIGDARILHRGMAPTRFYKNIRLSMAIKMRFDDYEGSMKKLGFII